MIPCLRAPRASSSKNAFDPEFISTHAGVLSEFCLKRLSLVVLFDQSVNELSRGLGAGLSLEC